MVVQIAMARIEKREELHKEVKKMRGQVVNSVQRASGGRIFRNWFCCLIPAFVLIGLFVFGLWFAAATGLTFIPGFSPIAYKQPEPARTVTLGQNLEEVLGEDLSRQLTERVNAGRGSLDNSQFTIRISEEDLTSTLRSLLERSETKMVDASRSQAVLQDGVIEFYLPVKNNKQRTAFVFLAQLKIEEGLQFDIDSSRLGNTSLPGFIPKRFIEPAVRRSLKDFEEEIGGTFNITNISIHDRFMNIIGDFNIDQLEISEVPADL